MWTYKQLSHRKSGHTITTRSCKAKEIPILDLLIHRHGSFTLSLSCQFINAVFLCFQEVSGQKESTIHPAMDNMTWYGKSNSWIELNSGAKWIVIESHLHWVKPPPSPTPKKTKSHPDFEARVNHSSVQKGTDIVQVCYYFRGRTVCFVQPHTTTSTESSKIAGHFSSVTRQLPP
jgi:hypothetical protein